MEKRTKDEIQLGEANDRLSELLLEWEESIAAGLLVSTAELCRDCPELINDLDREIAHLRVVDRFIFPRQIIRPSAVRFPTIPGYDILQEIGRGGMGVVYKARQLSLGRLVAIKTLVFGPSGQSDFIIRLRQEAKALSQLNHPHIVQVIDVVETSEAVSLILEYIEGETLANKLNGKPIPASEAAAIALTLARTLVTVHEQGLLHRDIKPANVLIDALGQIKLADFGLVKSEDSGPGVTQAGEVIGSPNYMAPEQADGPTGSVDARTDVYSLGTTLYEMLTGRPPFVGTSTIDILDQVRQREPVALRQLNPGTPRDLETICLKCLEKSPASRFGSAQELSDELQRFLHGTPIRSRPIRNIDRCRRWIKRHPATAGLAGLSVAAGFVIAALLVTNYRNLGNYNRDLKRLNSNLKGLNEKLVQAAENAQELRRIAELRELQANESLYAADIGRAATAWQQTDTRGLMDLLDRHIPKPDEPDLRGFEWWYLRRQANIDRRVLIDVGTPIYFICYSPDRRVMACAGSDSIVRLFDPDSGIVQKHFPTNQLEINGLAFSPDETEIATSGDDGTIRIWNLSTGNERLKFQAQPKKAFHVLYTPDGLLIVSCGESPVIRVFNASTGAEEFSLTGHRDTVESIEIIDAGKTLVSTSDDNTVRIWDLEKRSEIRSLDVSHDAGPIAVLPDRRMVIVGNSSGSLQMFNFAEGREIAVGKHLDRMGALALHPNGSLLAAGDSSGQIRLRKIDSHGEFDETPYQPWQAHSGNVFSLVWSNDGSRLFSAGDDGRVLGWSLAAIQPAGPKSFEIDRSVDFRLIPKSNLMITSAFSDLYSTLWDWRSGKNLGRSQKDHLIIANTSPNGKFFAAFDNSKSMRVFATPGSPDRPLDDVLLAAWQTQAQLSNARFSPDSRSIAVSRWSQPTENDPVDHAVWILNVPSLDRHERIPVPNAKKAAFSPDGSKLAIAARAGLVLWSIPEKKILWEAPQADVNFAEVSPDGQLIATDGFGRTIIIRELRSGRTLFQLTNHRATILAMAFSPDGRLLATSSKDGAIKLWHIGRGQELIEFRAMGSVHYLEFSEDGTQLICQVSSEREHDRETILVFDGSPLER